MPDRAPYVGEGIDGAIRSAQIDREEAGGLVQGDPRRHELLVSADLWMRQAEALERDSGGAAPSVVHGEALVAQMRAVARYARQQGYTEALGWLIPRMEEEGLV
jgi:hypothetical protein